MILLDSTMSGNLARDHNGRKNFQSLASGSHHCQSQRLIAVTATKLQTGKQLVILITANTFQLVTVSARTLGLAGSCWVPVKTTLVAA